MTRSVGIASYFRPGRWSISVRLAVWYGGTLAAVLAVFSAMTYAVFQRSLHADFDQHLLHELTVLLPLIELDESGPVFSNIDDLRTVAYQTDGTYGTYVRLISPEGTVLYRSPNFQGHAPLQVVLPDGIDMAVFGRDWKGSSIRSHYHPLFTSEGTLTGWLEVSGFEWSVRRELGRLFQTLALGTLLSFLLALFGGYVLARRSLAPVARITEAANDIRVGHLDRRVPRSKDVEDELSRLADTINALLARLEATFRRERRFSADAAHELITPLAAVRGELELTLRDPSLPEETVSGLHAAIGDVDRMNGIVRSLLELSSAERSAGIELQRGDLTRLVRDRLARFGDRAKLENRVIETDLDPDVMAPFDPDQMSRVVDNLLDNACKYSETGRPVRVSLKNKNTGAVLRVVDQGIGFDPREAPHLFDRFYRGHNADGPEGSGLGLSIVQAIVRAHDGEVVGTSAGIGSGATFEVRLRTS